MRARTGAGARRGYSLVEVVVSLTAFIAILLAVLFVFNVNYRLARGRGDAAERREALRNARHDMVRLARMAARGGLPRELAVAVAQDVAAGHRIGGPGSPEVLAGTDVLTLRGVFSTPLFRVGPADGSLRLEGGGSAPAGAVEIRDPSPQTGVAQSLAELAATVAARRPDSAALVLVSQLDESVFAVVSGRLDRAAVVREGGRVVRVGLPFETASAPPALAGAGPAAALRGAAFVGLLEEYRFYVRAAFAAPGDPASPLRPQLSLARFVPGTDRPWAGDAANLAVDLADDVGDLQVAPSDDDAALRITVEPAGGAATARGSG